MTAKFRFALLLPGLIFLGAQQAVAQDAEDAMREELRKQEAFRSGFTEIVNDLNSQSYDRFVRSIDREDMLDRIYGLRLIDQRIKRQFEENIEASFDGLVKSGAGLAPAGIVPAYNVPEDGARYKLLGIESSGGFGRAVVRVDLANYQFDYLEFDLRLDSRDRVVIVDWTDYLAGLSFSESIGRFLVFTSPSPSALRKFIDTQSVTERDLYLFGETLKAARDGNIDKFVELRDSLAPTFQRQRVIVETGVHLAKARRQRRAMVEALGFMQQHYPEEPLYTLMLLDTLFPGKKYEEGIAALTRLADKLDVEDAAMDARLSAAYLAAGNPEEAAIHADRAIELEPDLELAWLSALPARNATGDFAGAVEALTRLESDFGQDLDPAKLEKSKVFEDLMASEEFAAWLETR
jgi:tetratricopeptide (TPR) repeat protein